jgi:hypothetical protein
MWELFNIWSSEDRDRSLGYLTYNLINGIKTKIKKKKSLKLLTQQNEIKRKKVGLY